MISITLTEEDAEEYLKQHTPETQALANSLKAAIDYIDVLEKQNEQEEKFTHVNLDDPKRHNIAGDMNKPAQHQAAEAKVVRDTAIAEETKPMEMGLANTKWTKGELGLIYYLMDRPETELNRKLDTLLAKLKATDEGGRTEPAIRAKLNELDIKVVNGIMYYN